MSSHVRLERFGFRLLEFRRALRAAEPALDFFFPPLLRTTEVRREVLRVGLLLLLVGRLADLARWWCRAVQAQNVSQTVSGQSVLLQSGQVAEAQGAQLTGV